MSRYTGPKGKLARRFGVNIFGNPKYDRVLGKRPNAPGQHGQTSGRRKVSEYGLQLLEKQKLKMAYGMREKQFRLYYKRALAQEGKTGDNLLILLETRLDNVIYRLTMAPSRDSARQMILHGHIKVNNRRVNIPSFQVSAGDIITAKDSTRSQTLVKRWLEENASRDVPEWLMINKDELKGQVVRKPLGEEIPSVANEQLVVELYSK